MFKKNKDHKHPEYGVSWDKYFKLSKNLEFEYAPDPVFGVGSLALPIQIITLALAVYVLVFIMPSPAYKNIPFLIVTILATLPPFIFAHVLSTKFCNTHHFAAEDNPRTSRYNYSMRPITIDEKRRCPRCGKVENQINKGKHKSGTQRCMCKECGAAYTLNPKSNEYPDEIKKLAIKTYYSGVSGRGVGKIFSMSKANVYNWIKEEAKKN